MNKAKFLIEEIYNANGNDLPFPKEEYDARLAGVKKRMEKAGIDLLYVTAAENLFYLSGLNLVWPRLSSPAAWNTAKATGIAISLQSDEFMLFEIADEEGSVLNETYCAMPRIKEDIPGSETEMFGKSFESPAHGEDFLDLVVKDLKTEGWLKGTVAMEFGSPRPSRTVSEMLEARFVKEGVKVVDGTDIVLAERSIKSPLEMACILKATEFADIAHRTIKANIREGISELEMVGEYNLAMYKAGGESMGIVDMCRFGEERFWRPHSPAGRRKLRHGDPIAVDLCGVYKRYHSNQTRSYFFGEPSEEFMKISDNGVKTMEVVKEIIRPGMGVRTFFDQMERHMKERGIAGDAYWFGGYELGIGFPPDWVGTFVYDPDVDPGDAAFLPGMVINFETGFGVIDTIMFTEDEAMILGTTPWEMQVVR